MANATFKFAAPGASRSMLVPHRLLTSGALRAIVEEFVTRDGTDHSAVGERIEKVLRQLDVGSAELHFEQETATCNILPTMDGEDPRAGHEDAS
jgi:uncharacterized protein YheU (UPF0270 family)